MMEEKFHVERFHVSVVLGLVKQEVEVLTVWDEEHDTTSFFVEMKEKRIGILTRTWNDTWEWQEGGFDGDTACMIGAGIDAYFD